MPKQHDDGSEEDPPGDQYEGMSDEDRAYMEEMEEKRQREQDTLDSANREAEYDRTSRSDEDDKRDE